MFMLNFRRLQFVFVLYISSVMEALFDLRNCFTSCISRCCRKKQELQEGSEDTREEHETTDRATKATNQGQQTVDSQTETMSGLLTFEQTMEGLEHLYKEQHKEDFPEDLKKSIEEMQRCIDHSNLESAKRLEEFSKLKKKLVKIHSETVPDFILPSGYTATLHDMKVDARGPDDKIYTNHPQIQKLIPRGTTTMELEGSKPWHDVIIYAHKKFTGGVGDEDDSQPNNDNIWREYCLEPPENAVKIVCMEKLNGDAVHFSGRYIDGKFYLIAGSKNVHLLIGKKSDIELYSGDRYGHAKLFAKTVWDTLESLNERVKRLLYSFLHHTKVTAVCEILQPEYQHIVNLSYLKESELNFITFTPTASENEDNCTTLTAYAPHHTLRLGRALGLTCAPFTEIEPGHLDDQRERIRGYHEKEGEVLYYMNKEGKTFGIAKAKSVWYVYLRALREKAVFTFVGSKKNKPNWTLEDGVKSLYKRFGEIQAWLKVSDQCAQSWKELGAAFMRWMDKSIKEQRFKGDAIRPQFPVWWKYFLEEEKQNDKIPYSSGDL